MKHVAKKVKSDVGYWVEARKWANPNRCCACRESRVADGKTKCERNGITVSRFGSCRRFDARGGAS